MEAPAEAVPSATEAVGDTELWAPEGDSALLREMLLEPELEGEAEREG
jgi:hypothetical protein